MGSPDGSVPPQALLVDRLGEARSKNLVHFKGSIDNSSRQAIQLLVGFKELAVGTV